MSLFSVTSICRDGQDKLYLIVSTKNLQKMTPLESHIVNQKDFVKWAHKFEWRVIERNSQQNHRDDPAHYQDYMDFKQEPIINQFITLASKLPIREEHHPSYVVAFHHLCRRGGDNLIAWQDSSGGDFLASESFALEKDKRRLKPESNIEYYERRLRTQRNPERIYQDLLQRKETIGTKRRRRIEPTSSSPTVKREKIEKKIQINKSPTVLDLDDDELQYEGLTEARKIFDKIDLSQSHDFTQYISPSEPFHERMGTMRTHQK